MRALLLGAGSARGERVDAGRLPRAAGGLEVGERRVDPGLGQRDRHRPCAGGVLDGMQVLEGAQVAAHDDEVHAPPLLELEVAHARAVAVDDREAQALADTGAQRRVGRDEAQAGGRRRRRVLRTTGVHGRRGLRGRPDRVARDRRDGEDRDEQRAEGRNTDAGAHDTSVYPASSTAALIALSWKDSPATVSRLASRSTSAALTPSTWRTSSMTDLRQ